MTLDITMPFYGRVDHFRLAVDSVRAQTDPDWRLTVVDDVYPDLSAGEWVRSLEDPRITYIRNETNLGPSRNYRKCVDLMRSEFAVIMGCDDVMLPGYVRRVGELIARFPEASVIQPGVRIIDEDGRPSWPLADRMKALYRPRGQGARWYQGQFLAVSLLRADWAYFPSLCWRVSELVRYGFRVDLDVVQDLAMLLDITAGGGRLVLDDQVVFSYRRHSGSVSARTAPDGSKYGQERTLFAEAERAMRVRGWTAAARAARVHSSSRLSALAQLPGAVRAGSAANRRSLLRHVLGPNAAPNRRVEHPPDQ